MTVRDWSWLVLSAAALAVAFHASTGLHRLANRPSEWEECMADCLSVMAPTDPAPLRAEEIVQRTAAVAPAAAQSAKPPAPPPPASTETTTADPTPLRAEQIIERTGGLRPATPGSAGVDAADPALLQVEEVVRRSGGHRQPSYEPTAGGPSPPAGRRIADPALPPASRLGCVRWCAGGAP